MPAAPLLEESSRALKLLGQGARYSQLSKGSSVRSRAEEIDAHRVPFAEEMKLLGRARQWTLRPLNRRRKH